MLGYPGENMKITKDILVMQEDLNYKKEVRKLNTVSPLIGAAPLGIHFEISASLYQAPPL